eukprot:403352928
MTYNTDDAYQQFMVRQKINNQSKNQSKLQSIDSRNNLNFNQTMEFSGYTVNPNIFEQTFRKQTVQNEFPFSPQTFKIDNSLNNTGTMNKVLNFSSVDIQSPTSSTVKSQLHQNICQEHQKQEQYYHKSFKLQSNEVKSFMQEYDSKLKQILPDFSMLTKEDSLDSLVTNENSIIMKSYSDNQYNDLYQLKPNESYVITTAPLSSQQNKNDFTEMGLPIGVRNRLIQFTKFYSEQVGAIDYDKLTLQDIQLQVSELKNNQREKDIKSKSFEYSSYNNRILDESKRYLEQTLLKQNKQNQQKHTLQFQTLDTLTFQDINPSIIQNLNSTFNDKNTDNSRFIDHTKNQNQGLSQDLRCEVNQILLELSNIINKDSIQVPNRLNTASSMGKNIHDQFNNNAKQTQNTAQSYKFLLTTLNNDKEKSHGSIRINSKYNNNDFESINPDVNSYNQASKLNMESSLTKKQSYQYQPHYKNEYYSNLKNSTQKLQINHNLDQHQTNQLDKRASQVKNRYQQEEFQQLNFNKIYNTASTQLTTLNDDQTLSNSYYNTKNNQQLSLSNQNVQQKQRMKQRQNSCQTQTPIDINNNLNSSLNNQRNIQILTSPASFNQTIQHSNDYTKKTPKSQSKHKKNNSTLNCYSGQNTRKNQKSCSKKLTQLEQARKDIELINSKALQFQKRIDKFREQQTMIFKNVSNAYL